VNVDYWKKLAVGALLLLGILLVVMGLSFDAPGSDDLLVVMVGVTLGMVALGAVFMVQALHRRPPEPEPPSPISDEMVGAMFLAREETEASGQAAITDLHLLRGLLRTRGSAAEVALTRVGIDLEQLPEPMPQPAGSAGNGGPGQVPLSVTAQVCLQVAREEASRLGDQQVGTGHLLLALLRPEVSAVAPILRRAGLEHDHVVAIMLHVD
jgi:hypothetical protein